MFQALKLAGDQALMLVGDAPLLDCPVCGKQFATKHNLGQHWRVHSGERPFSCLVCGKGFKQKAHMQKHLSSHRQRGEVAGQVMWMGNPMEEPEEIRVNGEPMMEQILSIQ